MNDDVRTERIRGKALHFKFNRTIMPCPACHPEEFTPESTGSRTQVECYYATSDMCFKDSDGGIIVPFISQCMGCGVEFKGQISHDAMRTKLEISYQIKDGKEIIPFFIRSGFGYLTEAEALK